MKVIQLPKQEKKFKNNMINFPKIPKVLSEKFK